MLGLRYGTVQLVPYDPSWAKAFAAEHDRLRAALSHVACRIEHVGSTAVPGLSAKPILDIAVGVPADIPAEAGVSAIRELGYEYRGDASAEGGHILVRESEPLVRTHHVHVVDLGGPQWESYLLLRDFLRHDRAARDAYSAEKLTLAQHYPEDRKAYTAAKDEVVRRLLAEARRPSGCSWPGAAGIHRWW